jgi:hypothetical protein
MLFNKVCKDDIEFESNFNINLKALLEIGFQKSPLARQKLADKYEIQNMKLFHNIDWEAL